jgi:hypothetical protein
MRAIFPLTCVYMSHTGAFASERMCFMFSAVKHIEMCVENFGIISEYFVYSRKGWFGVIDCKVFVSM